MASVSLDDVRDVINVSSAEVPDVKVLKMVKRAEVTLELETGKEIDYDNCSNVDKSSVCTQLASIYPKVNSLLVFPLFSIFNGCISPIAHVFLNVWSSIPHKSTPKTSQSRIN